MEWTCVSHILIVLSIAGTSHAYFESCRQTINIAAGETKIVQSNGYPTVGYVPGSSCLYTIVAPVDYQIRASCYLNMYDPSTTNSCPSEIFYFAVDGKSDLSTASYSCGNQQVAKTSIGNNMVLAYTSKSYSGLFSCNVTTVCDCGWSVTSRIVGGTNASPNEFTPMVGIVSLITAKIFCGGTIVSSKFAVTAAHCLRVMPVQSTAIVVGEHDVTAGESNLTRLYFANRFIEHPGYSNVTNLNDIGLIETTELMVWSKAVGPVCLPFYYTQADFTGYSTTATGWGSTSFGGPTSNILQKVILKVLSNTDTNCVKAYPTIAPSQMCTFMTDKDTCQNDSGGPLFFQGPSDPRLFLIGLVSLGNGCGGSTPALNSRLISYLSWIESSVNCTLCRRSLI